MIARELPETPLDYVSAHPYLASLDYAITGQIVTTSSYSIREALSLFLHPSAPFGHSGSPDRRIIVDSRGVIILGWLEQIDNARALTITSEVAGEMGRYGLWDTPLGEMVKMEMLWLQS